MRPFLSALFVLVYKAAPCVFSIGSQKNNRHLLLTYLNARHDGYKNNNYALVSV